jgi:tetratricopeptide (TPR) repeat protein
VEAAYRRSLELGGERVASLHALGSLYAVAGDRPRALEFYDRATRADPEEFGAAWAAIELLIAEGQASALEAENRLEALLTADPPHARASLALARILLARGDDLTRAQALAKRSIRVRETPMALETLAAVYLELGEPERALRLAERGLVARPESGPLLFGLGRAMLALGRIDEARSAFESAAAAKGFEGAPLAREQLSRLVK